MEQIMSDIRFLQVREYSFHFTPPPILSVSLNGGRPASLSYLPAAWAQTWTYRFNNKDRVTSLMTHSSEVWLLIARCL